MLHDSCMACIAPHVAGCDVRSLLPRMARRALVLPLLPAAYARLAEEKTAGWRSACDSERQKAREFLQARNVPKTDLREPLAATAPA